MKKTPIKFNQIKAKDHKEVYEFLSHNEYFKDKEVYKTPYRGKESDNSYTIGATDEYIKCKALENFFKISNKDTFEEKFSQAVNGQGYEILRITVMHSSSLCALLCFYNVKNKNITIKLNNRNVVFTDSLFEWENTVSDNGGPSSIDVVLTGHYEDDNKKVVLFLESKFSEYLGVGLCHPREEYLHIANEFYNENVISDILGIQFDSTLKPSDEGWVFTIGEGNKQYATGIKQMISHYIGVKKLINGENKCKNEGKELSYKNADIYLGSILFNFNFKDNSAFKKYSKLYSRLAEVMRDKKPRFKILPSVLTYQSIFSDKNNIKQLDDNVIKYYKFKK